MEWQLLCSLLCVHSTYSCVGTSHTAPPGTPASSAIVELKDFSFREIPLNNAFAFPCVLQSRKYQLGMEWNLE